MSDYICTKCGACLKNLDGVDSEINCPACESPMIVIRESRSNLKVAKPVHDIGVGTVTLKIAKPVKTSVATPLRDDNSDAQEKANKIIEDAQAEANKIIEDTQTKIQQEVDELVGNIQKEIDAQAEKIQTDAKAEANKIIQQAKAEAEKLTTTSPTTTKREKQKTNKELYDSIKMELRKEAIAKESKRKSMELLWLGSSSSIAFVYLLLMLLLTDLNNIAKSATALLLIMDLSFIAWLIYKMSNYYKKGTQAVTAIKEKKTKQTNNTDNDKTKQNKTINKQIKKLASKKKSTNKKYNIKKQSEKKQTPKKKSKIVRKKIVIKKKTKTKKEN